MFDDISCKQTIKKTREPEEYLQPSGRFAFKPPQYSIAYKYFLNAFFILIAISIIQSNCSDQVSLLSKLTVLYTRIRLAFENGVDTLEEYAENKKRLKIERERLERQLVDIHNVPDKEAPSKDTVLDRVCTVYDVIRNPDIDDDTKGSFMRSLVEDIVFDKKNGRLIFHLYVS